MNKEMSSWIDKIKTLPNRNEPMANALCRMGCLSLMYTPLLIMTWMGIKFADFWLFMPVAATIALATVLSFVWRKFALSLEDQGYSTPEACDSEFMERAPGLVSSSSIETHLDFPKPEDALAVDKSRLLALDKRLNKLAEIATRFQWMGMAVIPLVVLTRGICRDYFGSYNHVLILQGFSVVALVVSFVLSRLYTRAGKKLEEARQLTEEEKIGMYHEYRGKFLWPHIFWAIMLGVFSCL
jgi:uncharacterized membrane protein